MSRCPKCERPVINPKAKVLRTHSGKKHTCNMLNRTRKVRVWLQGEDEYIIAHYGPKTSVQIAALLGRTKSSVRGRINRLREAGWL